MDFGLSSSILSLVSSVVGKNAFMHVEQHELGAFVIRFKSCFICRI
jgi:hypothetical protein